MNAAGSGNIKFVKELIQAGVGLNLQDREGLTALMYAFNRGHFDVIKALIQAGAHLDLCDKEGVTVLMRAAQRGSMEVMQELLNHGADTRIRNHQQETALDYAKIYRHNDAVNLLGIYEKAYVDLKVLGQVIKPKNASLSAMESNNLHPPTSSKRPRL